MIPDKAQNTITLQDGYFDLRHLAEYSMLAISTLRDYIRSGKLPAYKIRGKILIKKSLFDSWIEDYRIKKKEDVNQITNEVIKSLKKA